MKCPLYIAIVIAVLMPAAARAQSPATVPTTAPMASRSPATVPASQPITLDSLKIQPDEIASHAASTAITIKGMNDALATDDTVERISKQVNDFRAELDARRDELGRLLASNPSLQTLRTQDSDWHAFNDKIDSWMGELDRRQTLLSGVLNQLQQKGDDWELTLEYMQQGKIHRPEAYDDIDNTLRLIGKTQARYHTARGANYRLNALADDQRARVVDALSYIKQARDQAFERLGTRDSPPIWSTAQNGNVADDSQASFSTQIKSVRAYAAREYDRFAFHICIFALLAVALFWTRRRVREWTAADPTLKHATAVFESPIATALVLALLVSVWVYPQAPRLLWAFIGAASLIPTIFVLRQLIERRLYSILNALVTFYFFDQLRSVEASQPTLSRWLFLIEMGVAAVFLTTFLGSWRKTEKEIEVDRLTRWVRRFAKIANAIFIIAFATDALGFAAFATLIGDGMLGSAYLAVVIYAASRILDGLLMIALRARPLSLLGMVRRHHRLLQRRICRFQHVLAVVLWILGTLEQLSLREPLLEILRSILTTELTIGSFSVTPGHVVTFAIAVWASFLISRLIRFVLEEDVYSRFSLPGGIPYAISRMLHYVVLLIGFFIAVAALGYNMTQFTILGGAFAVGLGFGMQNIVNNFVSGLILLFERPVRVGDVIELDAITGIVVRIGIRASVIRTEESSEIIIPNGRFISDRVTNWTLSNRQRGIEIPVAVAAGTDPRRVIQLLEKVAAANPLVIDIPRPHATFVKFGADAFSFTLRVWTNHADEWDSLRSDLSVAINDALTAEKIPVRG